MTTFSNAPRLTKGGLVLVDPESLAILRVIALQYNPETMTRGFQIQDMAGGNDGRSDPMRLVGPPIETLSVDATIDAIDDLERGGGDAEVTDHGIHPQLAALEKIVYPESAHLQSNNSLAASGALEIIPMEAPLTLFVWSKHRILPVRITELQITEEAFDTLLNPIRAKVSLGLRVLTVDDLGFSHKGGSLFMNYLRHKEALSEKGLKRTLSSLGIGGLT
jgi:hypothetical protein